MLNFTKTVSCSVIGTAQQIDTDTRAETEKNYGLGFAELQNIGSLKPYHVLFKQSSENVFDFR